jgi:hypothetical protein
MKVHYFQRYSSKENVSTANTMLLLSRLYSYSPDKFYNLIRDSILPEEADIEISFGMQESAGRTIPDAIIRQDSFKVAVETKLYSQFTMKQLMGHLESFENEKYQVLLTLDPRPMKKSFKNELDENIIEFNKENGTRAIHKHLTFKEIIAYYRSVVDDRDYEMIAIIDDYEDFCNYSGLIPNDEQKMRMQLAGATIEANKKFNLYYDSINRGYSEHAYLGLYTKKSVRAIGKITDIVEVIVKNGERSYTVKKGAITDEMKKRILEATEDAINYGYELTGENFFFVEKFYDTDFKKETTGAPFGSRMFNLTEILGLEKLPDSTEKIAEMLKEKTWK